MRRVLLIAILYSMALAALAQSTIIELAWTTSPSKEGLEKLDTRIEKLVTGIQEKRYRNDQHKLYDLFKKTHTTFLYQYSQYSDIDELADGKYDCLTATTLFADVLSRADFEHDIIETNYHIFIVVKTREGDVILETTDRVNGFINDKKKVTAQIAAYRKNVLERATSSHHQYSFSLYQPVNTDQLKGLLYFNQAVKAFNAGDWAKCSEKLSAAARNINSPRIAELSSLLNQQASSN